MYLFQLITNNVSQFYFVQASKAGLCIYRPGIKMEEEESQGWFSWMWNWGGEAEAKPKEVKTGGMSRKIHSTFEY